MTATQTKVLPTKQRGKKAPVILTICFGALAIPVWIFFVLNYKTRVQSIGYPQGELWYQKVVTDDELKLSMILGFIAIALCIAVIVSALMMQQASFTVKGLIAGVFAVATIPLFVASLSTGVTNVNNSWVRSQLAASTNETDWTFPGIDTRYGKVEEALDLKLKNSLVVTSGSGKQMSIYMIDVGEGLWSLKYQPVVG